MFGWSGKKENNKHIQYNQLESNFAKLARETEQLKETVAELQNEVNRLKKRFKIAALFLLFLALYNIYTAGIIDVIKQNWDQLEPLVWIMQVLWAILLFLWKDVSG